jgi:chorismate mutase
MPLGDVIVDASPLVGRPCRRGPRTSSVRRRPIVNDVTELRLKAIRGATTAEQDTSDEIADRTEELLRAVIERNGLEVDDIVSVIFTATPDLVSDFPAVAARRLGLSRTPLLCSQEIPVAGAVPHCIRVLVHCYAPAGREMRHVYLHEARQLRLDLPE